MMDLREFVKVLEEEHELQKIKVEVDPKHELGAICKIHNERPNSPALLFENVKATRFQWSASFWRATGAWLWPWDFLRRMSSMKRCGGRAIR